MNWWLAKMIFRIVCGNGDHTAQFDEQLRLIRATTRKEAFQKANDMGAREEECFFNAQDQIVQWQFISVCELYQLNELIDGAELYSRIEEKDNADGYIHTMLKKAEHIRSGNQVELMNIA